MLQLLAPGGTILLVASEDRRGGVRMFKEHLAASGFHVEETRLVSPMGVFRFYECRERLLGDPPEHPEVVHRVEQAGRKRGLDEFRKWGLSRVSSNMPQLIYSTTQDIHKSHMPFLFAFTEHSWHASLFVM